MKRLTGVVVLLAALTACGGDSEAKAETDCETVPGDLTEAIADGAEGVKITPGDAAAVRATDRKETYFIAMRFAAPGGGEEEGVWASNSLTAGDGLLLAVDGFAQQFTTWPDADKTAAKISAADPSVEAAKNCL